MKNKAITFMPAFLAIIALMTLMALAGAFIPQSLSAQTAVPIVTNTGASTVGASSELEIDNSGLLTVSGAQIQQIAGSTFFTRVYWGNAFLRVTILTSPTTQLIKHYGGTISLSQISPGDYLSAQGTLTSGSSDFQLTATSVKDWSIETDSQQFSGTVASLATSTTGFTLINTGVAGMPSIFVSLNGSTIITKGDLTLSPSEVQVGDHITTVNGTYDYMTNTLTASTMNIYVDLSQFQPQNFQGVITTIAPIDSTKLSLPAQMGFAVYENGATTTYSVNLPVATSVLSANRSNAQIGRFLPGDSVRVYGAIEQANHNVIDAQVVRDLEL